MTFRFNMLKKKLTRFSRPKHCFFCGEKQEPNYKEVEGLRRFVSERGKIISRARTGICRKHQRKLTFAVKRARILALLPFVVKVR